MTTPILTTIKKNEINMFYDQSSIDDIGVGIGTTHYMPVSEPQYRASIVTSKASNLYTADLKIGSSVRLGIGTTLPQHACHVIGNTYVGCNVTYTNTLSQRTTNGTLNITSSASFANLYFVTSSKLFYPQIFNFTSPTAVGLVYERLIAGTPTLIEASYLVEIGIDSYRTAIGFTTYSVQFRLGATGATTIDINMPHQFYHSQANIKHHIKWHKMISIPALKLQPLYAIRVTASATGFDAVSCASFTITGIIISV